MISIVKRREGSELELVLGGLERGKLELSRVLLSARQDHDEDDEAVRCRASCARHDARADAA